MPKFVVDGVEYNSEDLDSVGQAQLESLRYVDKKINEIQEEILIFQAARKTYLSALKVQIEKMSSD